MIYSINLMDLTEKISPLAFAKYLKDTGWEPFESKRTYVKIFQQEKNGDFFQVIVPTEKELSDYKEAMYKAVETVAVVENKSMEQVILYLLNPNTDILKICLKKSTVEAGNILMDDAIRIYENIKKLLESTVLDILHPKKYHLGRIDECVLKFLSNCRFGQTEIGGYVISVVCPFAELNENGNYKQLSVFTDREQCANSLTRQVTSRVMENILFIKNQIDIGKIDKLVLQNNDKMISANFYEALAGLNLNSDGADVEFIAEWSPIVKNVGCAKDRILLTHDYYQPIETIIRKLKKLEFALIFQKEIEKNTLAYYQKKSPKNIEKIKKLKNLRSFQRKNGEGIAACYRNELDIPFDLQKEIEKRIVDYYQKKLELPLKFIEAYKFACLELYENDLFKINGTQGDKQITGPAKDEKVDCSSEKPTELKRRKNKKIIKKTKKNNSGAHNLF